MKHFYSRTTIDGSAPAYGMPQQTTASMFGKGTCTEHLAFLCQTLVRPRTLPGIMVGHMQTPTAITKYGTPP
jgi:hypothetical protein